MRQTMNYLISGDKPSRHVIDNMNLDFLFKYTKIELLNDYQIKEGI